MYSRQGFIPGRAFFVRNIFCILYLVGNLEGVFMSKKFYAAVAFFAVAFAQVSFAVWGGSAAIPKVVKDGESSYYE